MKILLDENIDIRMKVLFADTDHQVFTVRDMGWTGFKNGALLKLLQANSFECWVVVDKNIPSQQNLNMLPCLVIVLDTYRNTLKHLTPLFPALVKALEQQNDTKLVIIS